MSPARTTTRSVMLRNLGLSNELSSFREPAAQQLFRVLAQDPTPRIHPGLQGIPEEKKQALYQKDIHSFLWYPVVGANEGLLEMASLEAEAFSEGILPKLERISPLIQELLRYQLGKFSESLEGLIKKNFTPLQPAVAWKFYDLRLLETHQYFTRYTLDEWQPVQEQHLQRLREKQAEKGEEPDATPDPELLR